MSAHPAQAAAQRTNGGISVADRNSLLRTIGMLEQQRDLLGEAATELALAPLRSRLAALDADTKTVAPFAEPPSERKVVTVVFVDIVGFTSMSEHLESETVVEIVNGLFDRLTPVIERYGGTVDKFIGDEIMAVFGAPNAAERHAEYALRATLDIFAALAAYNRDRGLTLGLHIGANTGTVIAGEVGSRTRRQYSVTGDTVNVAARLGGAAAAGCILVGPSTFRHASHIFDFEALEPLPLKGKARPLPVYRLVGEKPQHAKYRDDGVQLSFSGRSDELDLVVGRARSDPPPHRGVIGIVAEPGVGKSRLVSEIHARLEGEARWVEASAREYRSDVSYAVVHELLDGVVGLANRVDDEAAAAAYVEYLEGLGIERASAIAPYLLRLRGLSADPASDRMLSELAPDVLRQRMGHAVADLLAAGNSERGYVLCAEDLHWADPSSISMLRALPDYPASANTLVLFTTRPGECTATSWIDDLKADTRRRSVIELGPLSDSAVDVLLDRTLGSDDGWRALRNDIRRKVQGNPLYLVSLLRSLVDEGTATLAEGRLTLARAVDELSIPEDLHAVVGSRIDSLPRRAKQVLQRASVLGAEFRARHVARLSRAEGDPDHVDETLLLLSERQFVQQAVDGQFRFVHAVVRDVAYEQMLQRDRRRLHLAAARLFEEELSQSSEADVALLAWHYERADERSLASRFYEQAATLASKSHANQEQLRYLDSAIALAGVDEAERVNELRERAADVLHSLGRFGEAADRFAALLPVYTLTDFIGAARLHRKIARACTAQLADRQSDGRGERGAQIARRGPIRRLR